MQPVVSMKRIEIKYHAYKKDTGIVKLQFWNFTAQLYNTDPTSQVIACQLESILILWIYDQTKQKPLSCNAMDYTRETSSFTIGNIYRLEINEIRNAYKNFKSTLELLPF